MKKLLCTLIFCLSFISAFAWRVDPVIDEFGDLTNQKALRYIDKKENILIKISKTEDKNYELIFISGNDFFSYSSIENILKLKIDNSKPMEFTGVFYEKGFLINLNKKQLDIISNGKIAKFSIPSETKGYVLKRIDLGNIKELVHEIY